MSRLLLPGILSQSFGLPVGQYFTNFSEYTIGSPPSDWDVIWDANSALDIVDLGGGDKGLEITNSASGRNAAAWQAIDSDPDRDEIEIFVEFIVPSGSTTLRTIARGSGDGSSEQGYFAGTGSTLARDLLLTKLVSGTFSVLDDDPLVGLFAEGDRGRIRQQSLGTNQRAKMWNAALAEPETYRFDVSDSAVSGVGRAGIFYVEASSIVVTAFGVGTGGQAAPTEAP